MTRTTWIGALVLAMLGGHASAGQFRKAAYHGAGQNPYKVVQGQFTQSGNLDLVFADFLSNQLCVLLGKGDGTFHKPQCLPTGEPVAAVSGDFDEDGSLDLAVTEFGGTGQSVLGVFLGSGKGTFRLAHTYLIGVGSGAGLAVADFNGDGHLDIVANNPSAGKSTGVQVFFGTGKGTFLKPATYKIANTPGAIAAGDLNGDHYLDLAVDQFGTGSVAVLLNDGTGHFSKPVSYSAGGGEVVDVKIADLRNNGKQDLVIANDSAGMVVLLNKGDGTFGKPTTYRPNFFNWQPPEACTVADFSLDGKPDVTCAANLNDAYIFYNNGDGTFKAGIEIKNTINHQGGYSIASGDFNGDNAPDLAIPIELNGKVAILLNTK